MADKDTSGGSARSDLDPFLELTRIMGFDPREPAGKPAEKAADTVSDQVADAIAKPQSVAARPAATENFGLDLERELLGDISAPAEVSAPVMKAAPANGVRAAYFDAPQSNFAVPASEKPAARIEPEPAEAVEAVVSADSLPEAELPEPEVYASDDMAEEPVLVAAASELEQEPEPVAASDQSGFVDSEAEDLVDALLADAFADQPAQESHVEDVALEPTEAQATPEVEPVPMGAPVSSIENAIAAAAPDDAIDIEASLDAAFADDPAPVADAVAEEPVAAPRFDEPGAEEIIVAAESVDADEEFAAPAPAEPEIAVAAEPAEEAWEPAPYLPIHGKAAAVEQLDAHPDSAMAATDMDFTASESPAANMADDLEAEYNALLGNRSEQAEAKPAPAQSDSAAQRAAAIVSGRWNPVTEAKQSAVQEPDPFDQAFADFVDKPPVEEPVAHADEFASDIDDDLARVLAAQDLGGEPDAEEPDKVVAAEDIEPEAPQAEPTKEDPFAALAAMAAKYQTTTSTPSWRDAEGAVSHQPAARPPVPEIETFEVHDSAIALADDLDLPDVQYEEERDPYAELDSEFNALLSEMSSGDPRPSSHAVAAPVARAPIAPQPTHAAYVEQRPAARPAPQAKMPAADPDLDQFDDRYFEDSMAAFEADSDGDALPTSAAMPMGVIQERSPRRGLMIAAIVGGLALIGGISAVAMSFGSSGETGEIAFIKADQKPVKVRPATPNTSTASNQAGTVYDTVSREKGAADAGQARLVNTAEEPVNLPSPDDEEVNSIAESEASMDANATDDAAKGEDRIQPSDQAEVAQNQDTIAVAPRKVRTMIVKSDGTMVPRAEPQASTDSVETEAITTGATTPTEEPAAKAAAAEPAAPAPVAAVPAGTWSVQVSSQPSEDGANKSLKDISRKYASVLGDHGVAVVKADVNGKTMWRVRVPAGSRDEAMNLCGSLKAAGGSCFVTK